MNQLRTSAISLLLFVALEAWCQSDTIPNKGPWISTSGIYPIKAQEAGISGNVIIQFEVDSVCQITNKRVIQGLGYGCDEAALRLINGKYETTLMKINHFKCAAGTMTVPIAFTGHE